MARLRATQRREVFIQAAVDVIAEFGVDGATTRRIAAQAGAPLASLHYCFSSKEELFFAIYEQQIATLENTVWQVRERAGLGRTAASLLRQLMGYYQSAEKQAHAQAELFFWVLRQEGELASKAYQIHLEVMIRSLNKGMREGDEAKLVEPLARMIAAVSDGLVYQWLAFRDPDHLMVDIDLATEAMERLADGHRAGRP